MSDVWRVMILDGVSTPGSERRQDVTQWTDMSRSDFHPTLSDKVGQSRAYLSFPIATPDLRIREKMEVWAGFVDSTSGNWTVPWFGGYIETITSTTMGGEHTLELELVDYGCLLSDTEVLRWPRELDDPIGDGYPMGYSVTQWLVGGNGAPYTGVIPKHLQNISWEIDPIFDQIILTALNLPGIINPTALPGDSTIYGEWLFTSLRKILEDLADMVHYIDPTIQPAFFMRAVAYGDDLIPEIVWVDTAESNPPVSYVFSSNPVGSEIALRHPFTHKRDAKLVRTRVTVKGIGHDISTIPDGEDPILWQRTHATPLNWYTILIPEHAASAPTKYQVTEGWSGAPIQDDRINTVGKARGIAEHIEQQVWGARGTIEFQSDVFVLPGLYIQIRDPAEFGDSDPIYPVNEVRFNPSPGEPLYTIVCGHTPIDMADLLKGGSVDIPILSHDTGRAASAAAGKGFLIGGSFTPSGQPKGSAIPIVQNPTHHQQNQIQPWMRGQMALSIGQSAQLDPNEDPDHPVRAPLVTVRDANAVTSSGYDANGHEHPVTIVMSFAADGKRLWSNHYPCKFIREERTDPTFNAGVTISYLLNGVVQPTPTRGTPLVYSVGDTLTIVTTGVDATVGMGLRVMEYDPPTAGGKGWVG